MSEATELVALRMVSLVRPGSIRPELNQLSLTIAENETVIILGEAESGADAVLRLIGRATERNDTVTGDVAWRGQSSLQSPSTVRTAYLASPAASFFNPGRSVASQLVRVIARKFDMPSAGAREELMAALARLPRAPAYAQLTRRPAQIEPSQLAWAMLASVIACAPDLILADDPVRGLSPITAKAVTDALLEHRRRLGAALVYSARALDPAIWSGGRIVVMRQGLIVEEGPAERLASEQTHAYTQTLFRAMPRLSLQKPARTIARGETLLRVQGIELTRRDEGAPKSRESLSFELRRGASLALIGEDGSGRRDVVRAVLGLKKLSAGRVVLDAVDLNVLSESMKARLRRRVAFITGADDALDERMTLRDTVDEPLRAHLKLPREMIADHRETALKRVGLASHAGGRAVGSLSAFDKRRLQIARAIVSSPLLAIVDEPLRGLDAYAQVIVRDLLMEFRGQEGPAFLVVTSDFAVAQALADDAIVFKDEHVLARGPIHDLLREMGKPALLELIDAAVPRPSIALSERAAEV
jgi:peptide/nickel transport system ATP-binding protein